MWLFRGPADVAGQEAEDPRAAEKAARATNVQLWRGEAESVDLARYPLAEELEIAWVQGLTSVRGLERSRLRSLKIIGHGVPDLELPGLASVETLTTLTIRSPVRGPVDLPPNLVRLELFRVGPALHVPPSVRTLSALGFPELSFAEGSRVESAHISEPTWADASPLAGATRLRTLHLEELPELRTLAGLGPAHARLRSLRLAGCDAFTHFGWKKPPPKLRTIFALQTGLRSLAGVESLALTKLALDGSKTKDLSALASQTELKELSLRHVRGLDSLQPLAGLPLKKLWLDGCNLARHEAIPESVLMVARPAKLRRRPKRVRAPAKTPRAPRGKGKLLKKLRALLQLSGEESQAAELALALDDEDVEWSMLGSVAPGPWPRVEAFVDSLPPAFLPDPVPTLVPNAFFDGPPKNRVARLRTMRRLLAHAKKKELVALRGEVTSLLLSGYETRTRRQPVTFAGLEHYPALRTLYVVQAPEVHGLDAAAKMTALRELFVEQVWSETMPVPPGITTFAASACRLRELGPIAERPLRRLRLHQGVRATSLAPVAQLRELEEFTFRHFQRTDVRPLAGLPLRRLDLRTFVEHLEEALDGLPTLEHLVLHEQTRGIGAPVVEAIARLPRLRSLTLNAHGVSLSPLVGHPTIEELDLRGQRMRREDARVIESLPELGRLRAKGATFGGHRFSARIRALRE